MSEVLEALLGSKAKARLIRFFILNPDGEFSAKEINVRNMLNSSQSRKELNILKKIKFINEKVRKGEKQYNLNKEFAFHSELKGLISKSNSYPQCKAFGKIKKIGDVKLVLISGIFLNHYKGKVDMILVANDVSRSKLKTAMNHLEAEVGREIVYVLMNAEEFKYRMDMLDRFILDFLEEPYEEVVNKLPIFKRVMTNLKKY